MEFTLNSGLRIGLVIALGMVLLQPSGLPCRGEHSTSTKSPPISYRSTFPSGDHHIQSPLMVGVLDFDTNQVSESDARTIADRMRIYLNRSEVFEVLERGQMNEILAEQGFQLSGACDTDECVVQVGRIIGARKMIAGSVSQVGKLYSLQVRIIDVSTGRIEETAYADTRGNIERVLIKATLEAAMKLIATVRESMGLPQPDDPIEEELRLLGRTGPISIPEGWYMRFSLGAGTMDVITDDVFDADLSGFGMGMDMGIGMTINRRTSVCFNFLGAMAMPPTLDYGDYSAMASADTTANLIGFMVGLTHYLIPRSLYISAFVGYSIWDLSETVTAENTETYSSTTNMIAHGSVGSGFQLLIGKDWWLNRKVGFGLTLRALRYAKATSYGMLASFIWDF